MGMFRNIARVNDAAKSARINKENEIIESGKHYSQENRQKLIDNAGISAKLSEKNKIRQEKDARKTQKPNNKTTNVTVNNTKKVGVNDSNIQIANKGEVASSKTNKKKK